MGELPLAACARARAAAPRLFVMLCIVGAMRYERVRFDETDPYGVVALANEEAVHGSRGLSLGLVG